MATCVGDKAEHGWRMAVEKRREGRAKSVVSKQNVRPSDRRRDRWNVRCTNRWSLRCTNRWSLRCTCIVDGMSDVLIDSMSDVLIDGMLE